jgi:hypothetical protein
MSWHIIKLMIKLGKLKEAHERLGDDIRDRIVPNSGETVDIQGKPGASHSHETLEATYFPA